MKKALLSIVAAGALAAGGAASAQSLGDIVGSLFGFGPSYGSGTPAVVAGTYPYGSTVYVDQYGRHFQYDPYGRQVFVTPPASSGTIVGYDSWGRPIHGSTAYGNYAYADRSWDRDGDGVANAQDRWPHDSRYW